MHDIISIGDSTLDVFLDIEEASVQCNVDKTKCFLCLNYADKIPVEKITKIPGGNASNFAVGLSRLGLKSAIFTILGDDETGKHIYDNFKKDNVGIDYVEFDKGKNTNYSTVINFHGERTILSYHEPREYILPEFKESKWIYLTSVGSSHEKLHEQTIEYVKKTKTKLAFNPGLNQLRDGIEKLKKILMFSDILILNKDESRTLLGEKLTKDLMKEFHDYGVKMVVITDAENGSYAFDGKVFFEAPSEKVTMIDRTGAGDAYSVGFVSATILGKDIQEAMRWGAHNAASVVQFIGPQKGLLKKI